MELKTAKISKLPPSLRRLPAWKKKVGGIGNRVGAKISRLFRSLSLLPFPLLNFQVSTQFFRFSLEHSTWVVSTSRRRRMAKTVTPDSISIIKSNPTPDSPDDLPVIIVQVLDLKATGNRNRFMSVLSISLEFLLPLWVLCALLSPWLIYLVLLCIFWYDLESQLNC